MCKVSRSSNVPDLKEKKQKTEQQMDYGVLVGLFQFAVCAGSVHFDWFMSRKMQKNKVWLSLVAISR